jgi:ABC-type glycerol-3-phosphate transport system substrate-binding protein
MMRVLGLGVSILFVAIALACLLVITPTTAGSEAVALGPNDLGDPVTIIFWHQHFGAREEFLLNLIEEFNTSNSYNITVEGHYAGGYYEIYDKVTLGLRGDGPLPNAVVGYPSQFADYARYGGVRFLDEYLEDPEIGIADVADIYPEVLSAYRLGQYGNQLAGVQHGRSIEVMYYNADLLAGAALPIPLTWEEFETACMAITTETISGTVVNGDPSRFATWLWSRGGELLSDDLSRARFHEQEGIDALQFFQDLFAGGYGRLVASSYEDISAFGNGETGFTFGSSAGIPYYRRAMEDGAGDEWGVTHVPSVPGNEVIDVYGAGIGVLRQSDDQDRGAWLFIRWLAEQEQTARWAALSGYFPVRISATTHPSMTEKLANDPQYAQAYDLLPLGRSEPGIRYYEQVRAIIRDAISASFGGANVADALQYAAVEVDALLADSGPASQVIPPEGGTLVFTNTQGLSATLEFPAGAVADAETVSYVPLDDLPTGGLAFALVPDLTFAQPVTITIEYRDSDVEGMDEEELKLYIYHWSSGLWVDADPCGGYIRDPLNNILEAGICHFSDYALGDWPVFVNYLPLTLRGF